MDPFLPTLMVCLLSEMGTPAAKRADDVRTATLTALASKIVAPLLILAVAAYAMTIALGGLSDAARSFFLGALILVAGLCRLVPKRPLGFGLPSLLIVIGFAVFSIAPIDAIWGGLAGLALALALPFASPKTLHTKIEMVDRHVGWSLIAIGSLIMIQTVMA